MTPLRAKMIKAMQVRGFSMRTHESYLSAVTGLARYFHRSPDKLGVEDLRRYIEYLATERELAPVSAIRTLTEGHAQAMHEAQEKSTMNSPDAEGVACLIAELDGSMVPIVDIPEAAGPDGDRRQSRTVRWQEARLALAHPPGSVHPVFGATLGDAEAAGDQLAKCARRAGFGKQTQVHALGDGAPWIAEQVDRVFGAQAQYLVDFYHLCDYLAAAAKRCAPDQVKTWFERQKHQLKTGHVQPVLDSLQPHLEPEAVFNDQAPVRACHRYLTNRLGQLDYPAALEAGLPIGSGEVESAHRYVIQDR